MAERSNVVRESSADEGRAPLTQSDIDRRIFELYDEYCHGRLDRRAFLRRAATVTAGGLAMAQALLPRYADAQTISFTDSRIKARYVGYPSPGGTSGSMRGYLVQPAGQGRPVAEPNQHAGQGREKGVRRAAILRPTRGRAVR